MRTTLSIQDNILEKAKRYSSEKGLTLGQVFERALGLLLKGEAPREKPTFKLITFKGELANPSLNLDRTSALLNEDEAIYENIKPR